MSSINFANAWLLLLALPLLVLMAIPYVLAIGKDNRNSHNTASAVLHVIIALFLALSAAGTNIQTVLTQTHVYVLADLSYSARKNTALIDGYIASLEKELPQNTQLGVFCFGKDIVRLTMPGEELVSVSNAKIDDSESDIVGALDYVSVRWQANVKRRVVLITDGKQTSQTLNADGSASSRSDALQSKVNELNSKGIRVDAIYLDSNAEEGVKEVQLHSAEYSQNVYKNQKSSVTALLQSTVSTNAQVTLSQNGEVIDESPIAVNMGATSVTFLLPTHTQGEYEYEIRVTAEEDENTVNNSFLFTQTVANVVNVLFISDNIDDRVAAQEIYTEEYANLEIYSSESRNIPCSITELAQFDEIILSNVDVSKLQDYALFVENLETVVSLLGKSLVGIGNLGLQNTTDESLLKLADMLPVRYGNSVRDGKLYTVVIDCSSSMMTLNKLNVAKSASKKLVDMLEEKDELAIVAFYGDVDIISTPQKVTDPDKIKEKIDAIDLKQGTHIGLGLQTAKEMFLQTEGYSEKQILLISDGLNSNAEAMQDDLTKTANELKEEGVGISVIGTISETQIPYDPVLKEADNRLSNISSKDENNDNLYWRVIDADKLASFVFAEIADDFGETLVNRNSLLTVNRRDDSVLNGLSLEQIKQSWISGFVNSRAKSSAKTVLSTVYSNKKTEVPVYATWAYGNGKTASFTSGISGEWIKAWENAGLDKAFFRNVLSANTPLERKNAPFTVTLNDDAGNYSMELTPLELKAGASVSVTMTTPEDTQLTLGNVVFDASHFIASFALTSVGVYRLDITYSYQNSAYTHTQFVGRSYLPEYDSFTTYDASPLYQMLGDNGTVSEDGKLSLADISEQVEKVTISLSAPLLITAIVLYAVDIIIRKLKWEDIQSLINKLKKYISEARK